VLIWSFADGGDEDERRPGMSAVVIARPKSFSREGGGLTEGDTGEGGCLTIIWWRNKDCVQWATCNTDNGTYGLPMIGDTSREIMMMSSNDWKIGLQKRKNVVNISRPTM
jgi:hypothetical protein